jgi:hypothetical protein
MKSLRSYSARQLFTNSRLSWLTILFIPVFFVLILRNGINFIGQDYYALDWAKKWPIPTSTYSVENAGNIILAKLFSVDSRVSWMLMHLVLTFLLLLLVILYCSFQESSFEQKQTIFLLIITSPLTMMIMQQIGWHDVVTIIGAVILAFSDRTALRVLGTLIMCLGNTPQALVSTFLFGLLLNTILNFNSRFNFKFFIPFLFALGIWILERFWLGSVGSVGREGEFFQLEFWAYSIKGFIIASPLYLYALLGPTWSITIKVWEILKISHRKQSFIVITLILVIPGIFGIITTDSSRDAYCIMAPLLLWFFRYMVMDQKFSLNRIQKITLILLPCFMVYREGEIIPPWGILERFFF